MEESEKRRERLKAMRMAASEAALSHSQTAIAGSSNLSNPLLEPFPSPSGSDNKCAASRFDFYTDPMSMFSGNKKRNDNGSQGHQRYFSASTNDSSPMGSRSSSFSAGTMNPEASPTAAHQFHINYSPEQRSSEIPLPTPMSCSWRTPNGVLSPFPVYRGTPGGLNFWNHSGGSPGHGSGQFYNHDYGRGSSPRSNSGRGNFWRYSSSPSPSSGRSGGRGGGRGRGFHGVVSAKEQPESFYSKYMVEDPWQFLQPVVRSLFAAGKDDLKSPDSTKSWLPKSVSAKKAKTSEVTPEFSPQTSIADCLSFAFQEAVEDAAQT